MKKYLIIIFIFPLFSCTFSEKENKMSSSSEIDTIKHDSINNTIDTSIVNLIPVDYNSNLYFGMSIAEWNKGLSILYKKGVFDGLNIKYDSIYSSVIEYKGCTGFFDGVFFPIYTDSSPNKCKIYKCKNILNNGYYLDMINIWYNDLDNLNQQNNIINSFIKEHKLKYLVGSSNIYFSNKEIDKHIEILLKRKNLPHDFKIFALGDSISSNNRALWENENLYVEFNNNVYTKNKYELIPGPSKYNSFFSLIINVYPKAYNKKDDFVNSFMTSEQKNKLSSINTSERLAKDALKEN